MTQSNLPDCLNFNEHLSADEILGVSALGLAYIGDAVFELLVRARLCAGGRVTARKMHEDTVRRVSARAQSSAARRLLPKLSAAERTVYMRGRNARVNSTPRGATPAEYHAATGLEALFGFLYLSGELERVGELFELAVGDNTQTERE
jgi:ribonuclease-3 family protein